jgi:hypothetical protein
MTGSTAELQRAGYYACNFYVFVACDCPTDMHPAHTATLFYRYGRRSIRQGRASMARCESLRDRVAAVDGQWSTVCN